LAGEAISPDVKRFIHSTINSVEQLEVLLFLMSNPDRHWTADEVSERVRLAEEAVAARLEELSNSDLLVVREGSRSAYCYAPKSNIIAEEVASSLNAAYKEGRDTVIQLIYTRPLDNIRIFADAFKIRRDS
jgi:hypothetical protein